MNDEVVPVASMAKVNSLRITGRSRVGCSP